VTLDGSARPYLALGLWPSIGPDFAAAGGAQDGMTAISSAVTALARAMLSLPANRLADDPWPTGEIGSGG